MWMQPAGLEAVGVGRDAAHGVDRDRPADHLRRASRPAQSVQGWSRRDLLARRRPRRARRRCGGCVVGRDAGFGRDASRGRSRRRDSARRSAGTTGTRLAAVGQLEVADQRRLRCPDAVAPASAPGWSCRRRAACRPASRANRPSSGRPGRRSPARARWCSGRDSRDRSSRRAAARGSARATNRPSVPGLMPIHSSAMAP